MTKFLPAFREMRRVPAPGGTLFISFHAGNEELLIDVFFVSGNSIPYTYFAPHLIADLLVEAGFAVKEHLIRLPYAGEVTTRAYIFAEKT